MEDLPGEILNKIFEHIILEHDLVQCQLTCRKWYPSTTQKLYSHITLSNEYRTALFLKTVTYSKNLAQLVKCICIPKLFSVRLAVKEYDQLIEALDQIIRTCFNLEKLDVKQLSRATYWVRIMEAGYKRELPLLQSLPNPSPGLYEFHCYATVAFKESLHKLTLWDYPGLDIYNLYNDKTFKFLASRLNQFIKLQEIDIIRHSLTIFLEDLDSIIQQCPSTLIKVRARYFPLIRAQPLIGYPSTPLLGFKTMTQPCANIESLDISWEMISHSDTYVQYLIHKFPNLNKLTIAQESRAHHFISAENNASKLSISTVHELFKYAVSIPSFEVDFGFRDRKDILEAVIELLVANGRIKQEDEGGALKIEYCDYRIPVRYHHVSISSNLETMIIARFSSYNNEILNELPHSPVIETAGKYIRYLQIEDKFNLKYDFAYTVQEEGVIKVVQGYWIDDILKHCPLLKKLVIKGISAINMKEKACIVNKSVETVVLVSQDDQVHGTQFWNRISNRLPSLKHIHFKKYLSPGKLISASKMFIRMPSTDLNTLRIELVLVENIGEYRRQQFLDDLHSNKFYLKVTALAGSKEERYFEGVEEGLSICSKEYFLQSLKILDQLTIEIYCNSIHSIHIKCDSLFDVHYSMKKCSSPDDVTQPVWLS